MAQPIPELVVESLGEVRGTEAGELATDEISEVWANAPLVKSLGRVVESREEVDRRYQQQPRGKCVATLDAVACRQQVEAVDPALKVAYETDDSKVDVGEPDARSEKEVGAFTHQCYLSV